VEARRFESADPATDLVLELERPSLNAFEALVATDLDVRTTFLAMAFPSFLCLSIRKPNSKGVQPAKSILKQGKTAVNLEEH